MPKNTMTIGIRIEDVTKLTCFNVACQFNLYKECGSYYCNLKYVELNEVGICALCVLRSLGGKDDKNVDIRKG